jgi:trk system potassium uptake protein TrkH
MFAFIPRYGAEGIWISVFLAVSAFCNAGFDILGREAPYVSLCNYNNDPYVLIIISSLIILGGLGFVVWKDVGQYKKNKRLMLHTKIVLIGTAALICTGMIGFLLLGVGQPQKHWAA